MSIELIVNSNQPINYSDHQTEGTSSSGSQLATYSGTLNDKTSLISTTGSMYLYMTSDSSNTRQGFLATYTINGTFKSAWFSLTN